MSSDLSKVCFMSFSCRFRQAGQKEATHDTVFSELSHMHSSLITEASDEDNF